MSVSARCSADNIAVNNNNDENCHRTTAQAEELQQQWISMGDRLGRPDAAAPIDINMKNINNNKDVVIKTEDLFTKLHESLSLESKFQPSLYLPQESQEGEITIGTRDGAAHVLRCLKVWYDLPSDVLFTAINLVDRFLTKMKVKPKHIACISVGSLHLATQQLGLPSLNTEDLVAISQCRRTSGDVERMAGIICNKLGIQLNTSSITALTFIRLFYYIFKNVAEELDLSDMYNNFITLEDLEMRLEVLICDASCANIRPSELALVLICTQMDNHINHLQNSESQHILSLVDYAIELQKLCRIPDSSFFYSHSTVVKILSHYNGQNKMPYKQRLVWKLSSRTMRLLRPTDRLTSYLPTIEEHNFHNGLNNLSRLRTGSVSSEDGEDWPTSPVVPVCEKC
jgi:cyclin G2